MAPPEFPTYSRTRSVYSHIRKVASSFAKLNANWLPIEKFIGPAPRQPVCSEIPGTPDPGHPTLVPAEEKVQAPERIEEPDESYGANKLSTENGETSKPADPPGALAIIIAPVSEIEYPIVDLDASADPVSDIMAAPEFRSCVSFFSAVPSAQRALVSPNSQALLFSVVRNLKPDHVYEIGSYQASTTEAVCRALHANGRGMMHTVDPFGADTVPPILERWPAELRERVRFYPVNSMSFFAESLWRQHRPDLVFVDGNHDYAFAQFDIEAAGQLLRPNGFIFVDNISQPGPFLAARDFLKKHPRWREHGNSQNQYRPQYPFDRHRTVIVNTDFSVLRAPRVTAIGDDPITTGEQWWSESIVKGISIAVAYPVTGTLYIQCVFRTFGTPPTEVTIERSIEIRGQTGRIEIPFDTSFRPEDASLPRRVEPWLAWEGNGVLELTEVPILY